MDASAPAPEKSRQLASWRRYGLLSTDSQKIVSALVRRLTTLADDPLATMSLPGRGGMSIPTVPYVSVSRPCSFSKAENRWRAVTSAPSPMVMPYVV